MDEEYENIVRELARTKEDKALSNTTMAHAFIGIRSLIENAENRIKIISNEFYEDFWVKLQPFLNKFLEKDGSNLEVIILEKYDEKGALSKLKKNFSGKINLFILKRKEMMKKIYNFVTVDPVGYRLELSDNEKKNKIVKGVINFGDNKGTSSLNELFETIKKISQQEVS